MKLRLAFAIAVALLLAMPSIAVAQETSMGSPAAAAPRDSAAHLELQPHKTHMLKYGAIGALAGAAVGAGVAAVLIMTGESEMEGLWYFYTVPLGLAVGAIVGASIGAGGGDRPPASSNALIPGQPQARSASLRIAATVTF